LSHRSAFCEFTAAPLDRTKTPSWALLDTWRSTPHGARNQSHHAYTPGGQSALSLDLFHLTLYSTPAATSLRSESELEAWLPDQSRLRTAKLDRVQNRAALKQGHGQLVHRVDERKA
jgi:hypothetical protein